MGQFIGDGTTETCLSGRGFGGGWQSLKRHLRAWSLGARFAGIEGMVLQQHFNDCGPTALQMVLKRFALPAAAEEVRRLARLRPQGTTLRSLGRAAEALGLQAWPWVLQACDLQRVSLPVLAWLKQGHYVVIDQVLENGLLMVLDPAVGRLLYAPRSFWKQWNGEALLFSRPGAGKPVPPARQQRPERNQNE